MARIVFVLVKSTFGQQRTNIVLLCYSDIILAEATGYLKPQGKRGF